MQLLKLYLWAAHDEYSRIQHSAQTQKREYGNEGEGITRRDVSRTGAK
jgi:hypothetical protein